MPGKAQKASKSKARNPSAKAVLRSVDRSRRLKHRAEEVHQKADVAHRQADAAHKKVQALEDEAGSRARRPPVEPPPPFEALTALARRVKKPPSDLAGPLDSKSALPFTVVGIGSSAGGFEAFVSVLRAFPKDSGVAIVYMQHLDPHHESKLADLLGKVSPVPLQQITTGTKPEPNRIYVLPANASVTLSNGRLRLGPRLPPRQPMPIDVFFRSLAREQQHRCIGVVLSGTGTDGTLGLAEIKGHGGLTFAQDQGSAKYFGMPGSAVAAGMIDFVMTPEAMAQEIARVARHTYSASPPAKPLSPPQEAFAADTLFRHVNDDMKALFVLMRGRTGADFSLYKPGTLNRRIMRRMVLQKIDSLGLYVRFLHEHAGEVDALFNDLLINVTSFFRDPGSFVVLQKKLLPALLKRRPEALPLRIWCCGCSTGEEAYSLAITVTDYFEKTRKHLPVQIFASDLNERAIERARSGVFSENIALDVAPDRLKRYFTKVNGNYQVAKSIRDLCVFATQNLVVDPPFSNLDIVSCRNVLIYLTNVLQKRIIPIFHYALKPGGFLMLGSSETIGDQSELFDLVDKTNKIYTKKAVVYRPTLDFEHRTPAPSAPPPPRPLPTQAEKLSPNGNLQQRIDRLILAQYSPPAVVINAQMDVLQFRGKTGLYLEHQAGAASLNLLKMAREDIALDLRRVVNKSIQTGERAHADTDFQFKGATCNVRIEVHPVAHSPESERHFLVLFLDGTPPTEKVSSEKSPARISRQEKQIENRRTTKLRDELAATKESLQAIIEEQEATNEELKSANEEIQSSNEELQSTNEELETAREELQSTNEELTTLNQELQNRNTELGQVNNDLTNLLASVNIAILMLDTNLTIRRFTPVAEKLFSLIPSDVGRRLTDLNRNIQVPDLEENLQKVIANLTTIQKEVQDRDGRWYSLRIRPYRTRESKIDGVVLMVFDIDELKRAISHTISLVRHPVLALQADLKVAQANEAFYRVFQITAEQVEGKPIYDINRRQWNLPRLKELLEIILPAQGEVRDFRIENGFQGNQAKSLTFNARRFYDESRGVQLILLAMEEITPR